MEEADRQAVLAASGLDGLGVAERELLAASVEVLSPAAREVLFHQGDTATGFYLLAAGRIKLSQVSAEGREMVVRLITPGQIFAAIALLPGRRYPVTATAVVASRVLRWSGPRLAELGRRVPGLLLLAGEAMANHMEEVTGRLQEVSGERVAPRLARTLLRLGEQVGRPVDQGLLLDVPLSRQDLAEMTGTTLYTVSRLLSAWEAEGVVSTGRERVVLCRPQRLAALAEAAGE